MTSAGFVFALLWRSDVADSVSVIEMSPKSSASLRAVFIALPRLLDLEDLEGRRARERIRSLISLMSPIQVL